MEDAEEDNGSAVAEVIDSEPIWGQPSSEARQLATNIQNLDSAAKARLKKASMLLRNSEAFHADADAFLMKRMAQRDDCISLMQKVWASEKKRRIGTGEEEKGTAQCSRDTGNVFTAITANQSTSEAKGNARTSEQETDAEQRGCDTLSPLDKIVKCWDALHEPKLCYLHQMLPDIPTAYLDRLDAFWDGDIPDIVYLELKAEPWKLPEIPSPSLSDSPMATSQAF